MELALDQALDEIRRLQSCLDNLVSIQALPVMWRGLNASQIVNTLLDVLMHLLALDFAGTLLHGYKGYQRLETVRLPPDLQAGRSHKLLALNAWIRGDLPEKLAGIPNPIGSGDVTVVPCRLGYEDEIGWILAASTRTGFPTAQETVALRTAANQVVVALHETRALNYAGDRLQGGEAHFPEGQQLSHIEESLLSAQAQLAHVTRLTTMGELVASIAHEVSQPLAAAATDADAGLHWLSSNKPNLEEARAAFTRIAREANRAGQVVTRIRAFVKKSRPVPSILSMNDLIGEVLTLIRPEIRSADVSLRTELAGDLRYIESDAIQLEQVLMNLVLNAIEAMRACSEGPRDLLLCSQNRGSDQIVIAVRDSGVGIDPDTVDDLFRPFVSSKERGLGLGLSISRSIVEAHGGVLWGERNADRGATFQFTLPAVSQHQRPA